MTMFNLRKSDKNNLRIISKPHACFQTMTKTPMKFQNNWYKTVGGVAPTRYPLSIHFVIDNAGKMAKFICEKKKSEDYIRTTCVFSDNNQNTSENLKEWV